MDVMTTFLSEFHKASKLPVFVFDHTGRVRDAFRLAVTPDFPTEYFSNVCSVAPGTTRVFTLEGDEYFSVIGTDNDAARYVVVWINTRTLEQTGYYEDKFPSIGLKRLVSYTRVLFFSLYRRLPYMQTPVTITDKALTITEDSRRTLTDAANEIQHNSYAKECLMLAAVEEGNLEQFNVRLRDYIQSGTFGQMWSGSELRNKKNLVLAATSLITRAAIRGGMASSAAFSLSDQCCQRVEKMTVLVSASNLIQEIGALFIGRVRAQTERASSLVVAQMKNYITDQTYGRIDLDKMAVVIGYTKPYLCTLFRQKVGMTIVSYANIQKVRETKSLLTFTKLTMAEISETLAFTDQSYFTRCFKKVEGVTPREYRKKYHV